jgi:hypothetical protein
VSTTDDIDRLQAELAKAESRAAKAREAAERAAALDAERRARRADRFDAATLELYDEVAWDQAVADAQAAFERALAEDPMVEAAVSLRQAKMRRRLADELRAGIASRLHGQAPTYAMPPTDVVVTTEVERYVERKGSELAHEEVERWWAAREAAGDE